MCRAITDVIRTCCDFQRKINPPLFLSAACREYATTKVDSWPSRRRRWRQRPTFDDAGREREIQLYTYRWTHNEIDLIFRFHALFRYFPPPTTRMFLDGICAPSVSPIRPNNRFANSNIALYYLEKIYSFKWLYTYISFKWWHIVSISSSFYRCNRKQCLNIFIVKFYLFLIISLMNI